MRRYRTAVFPLLKRRKSLYKKIVFIDFDGTITTEDTLVGAIFPFVDPKEVDEYNGKLEKGEMTLSQVVRYAYDGRPAEWLPKMLEYIAKVKIRPGFKEFLDKMALYDYEYAIGIGDSFTDMNMAQAVDTIFARDVLAKYLEKQGKSYIPYEDFFDVVKVMEEKFGN